MLSKIIAFSIKNKLTVGALILFWIGFGSYEMTKLPIDAVPDITNNQVQVITTSPALGAEDVERLITFPLEQLMSNIPHLQENRSMSRFGLSVITLVFDDEVDIYWARQQISERINQLELQAGMERPEIGPITTGLGEIYQYVLQPKKGFEKQYSLDELRSIQDWQVRRQLLGTKGVAEVSTFGGLLRQYEVGVDPFQLAAQGISMEEVYAALEQNNANTGGAYIEKGQTVLYIRSNGLIESLNDIGNIVVKNSEQGLPILVKDVGEVRIGSAIRYGALTTDQLGEVTGGIVMMLKDENSSEVIEHVKERVKEIEKTLPEGLEIKPFLDRTKMVDNAISTVKTNLLEGALIVLFVLVLFLGNIRAGLIVASVIPLSLLFAISMMNIFGVSGNLMSLGALDFGLIVDGAVIIVEAVLHVLVSKKYLDGTVLSKDQMNNEVQNSASKMMNAAVFGQIIILIVYLPILSLQGIEGKMFKPMAQTVAFAILGAFILSITYVPMMSSWVLSKKISLKPNWSDRIMLKIENVFTKCFDALFRFKYLLLSVVLALLVVCVMIFNRMGGEFIPQLEEGDFAVETRLLVGTNLKTTIETFSGISKELKDNFEEVEQVVSRIGSSEIPTDPMPIEAGDMIVVLKPKKEWKNASSFTELADKMSEKIQEGYPGVLLSFQFPVQMRFNELMTGAKQDVVVKIFGENLDLLTAYAEQIGKIVESVEGTTDVYVEQMTGMPQTIVNYDRQAMARHGITIDQVNRIVNASFAGGKAGVVYEGEKRFDLVVRMKDSLRSGYQSLENVFVTNAKGVQIPLRTLATIDEVLGPNQIQRENAKRRITVGFNVRGKDVESVVNELQGKVDKLLKMEPSYHLAYGGSFQNLQEAKERLVIAVPIALLLIFILLFVAFRNMKDVLLIFTAIPLSSIGGILALTARDLPFSISAGVGFIALFGVAVLNGIVLITEFNRGLAEHPDWDLLKVVRQGVRTRLRPVLMTASVASLGFIPMALSNGAGAEVQRPLATVVIGGLLSATVLTLFLLPFFYYVIHKKQYKARVVLSALVLFLFGGSGFAQTPISLEKAIEVAQENNRWIKQGELAIESGRYLKGSAFEVPKTNVDFGWGNYNSNYKDWSFSLGQTIDFPTVYANRSKAFQAQVDVIRKQQLMNKRDLIAQLRSVFYEYQLLAQRKELLHYSDSLLRIAALQLEHELKAGAVTLMEQKLAETQSKQVQMQLNGLENDRLILVETFNWILQADQVFVPENEAYKIQTKNQGIIKANDPVNNLEFQVAKQEMEAAKWNVKLQKSEMLPSFSFAYLNQSLSGYYSIQNQEQFLGKNYRFHSFQAGIAIPLFFPGTTKRLKFEQMKVDQLQLELERKTFQYNAAYQQAQSEMKKASDALVFYEETALPNSQFIFDEANLRYKLGEINFTSWLIYVQQVIGIQTEYLNALGNYNSAIIAFKRINNE